MKPRRKKPPVQPTLSLAELQHIWARKLAASGFRDVENSQGGLKTWSGAERFAPWVTGNALRGRATAVSSARSKLATAEYYRMVGGFLHSHSFATALDRNVWTRHAGGRTGRGIARDLELPHGRVKRIIRRLSRIMLNR